MESTTPQTATLKSISSKFPRSFLQKQESGLPLTVLAQPFGQFAPGEAPQVTLGDHPDARVSRCSSCFAYINNTCFWSAENSPKHGDFEADSPAHLPMWRCSLCGETNSLTTTFEISRYLPLCNRDTRPLILQTCPELSNAVYEFCHDEQDENETNEDDSSPNSSSLNSPVQAYVAVVSLAALQASPAFAESLVQGLNAAVEALAEHFMFSLVAYCDAEVHVFDLSSPSLVQTRRTLLSSVWHHADTVSLAPQDPAALMLHDLFPISPKTPPLSSTFSSSSSSSSIPSSSSPFSSSTSSLHSPFSSSSASLSSPFSSSSASLSSLPPPRPSILFPLDDATRTAASLAIDSLPLLASSVVASSNLPLPLVLSATLDSLLELPSLFSCTLACFFAAQPSPWPASPPPSYASLAANARGASASIDLFYLRGPHEQAPLPEYVSDLPLRTGGAFCLYSSADDLFLAQDVFRLLSAPATYRTLVRVRASPALRVAQLLGGPQQDAALEDLFHAPLTRGAPTLTIDLCFADGASGAFPGDAGSGIVQLAYAYDVLTIAPNKTNLNKSGNRLLVKHFTRIVTQQFLLADKVQALYDGAVLPSLVGALVGKIVASARAEGMQEEGLSNAKTLIGDWLTRLAACYNAAMNPSVFDPQARVDLSFLGHQAQLGMLPRLVYSFMNHPLLNRYAQCEDTTAYLAALVSSGLSPTQVFKLIHPLFQEYSADGARLLRSSLRLTAKEMRHDASYLYDAYTHIFVVRPPQPGPSSASLPHLPRTGTASGTEMSEINLNAFPASASTPSLVSQNANAMPNANANNSVPPPVVPSLALELVEVSPDLSGVVVGQEQSNDGEPVLSPRVDSFTDSPVPVRRQFLAPPSPRTFEPPKPAAPPASLIDGYIHQVRENRFPSPQVRYVTAGTPAAIPFLALLVEDRTTVAPDSDQRVSGFSTFLKILYLQTRNILHPNLSQSSSLNTSLQTTLSSVASSGIEGFASLFQFRNQSHQDELPV